MDKFNILNYLEKRQLGYNSGLKKDIYGMYIEKLRYIPVDNFYTHSANSEIGNTFACKFSKNKPNLHVVGCSSEYGNMVIQNTHSNSYNYWEPIYETISLHDNAIFNFAWAEPEMKLVTACGDQTSKLCSLHPSGKLEQERQFIYNSSVKSVMFCPGSSDIFCGGCQDGSIKVWDARVNNANSVINYESHIPNAHGVFGPNLKNKKCKVFGISSVIFKNDQTIISSSSLDPAIKLWDLRKSYRQVRGNTEPLSLMKFTHDNKTSLNSGYTDMVINPQHNMLYANGINNVIYCYSLDSIERKPITQYSGHIHETNYSKISITNDGHFLFSGCMSYRAVIWQTGYPYIEHPIFRLNYEVEDYKKVELSTSDWCADPSSLKLATSGDSMPSIWTMIPDSDTFDYPTIKFVKTSKYQSKLKKEHTVPIRMESEFKKLSMEEAEANMEFWDLDNTNSEIKISTKSKQPKNILLKKDTPPTITIKPNRKRKRTMLSSQNSIDQYLISHNKEKLNADVENSDKKKRM